MIDSIKAEMDTNPVAPCGCVFPSPAEANKDHHREYPTVLCARHSAVTSEDASDLVRETPCQWEGEQGGEQASHWKAEYLVFYGIPRGHLFAGDEEYGILCRQCALWLLAMNENDAVVVEIPKISKRLILADNAMPYCDYSLDSKDQHMGQWEIKIKGDCE